MSEEEKKAIETARCIRAGIPVGTCNDDYIYLLNLIEKQEKEIEFLREKNKQIENMEKVLKVMNHNIPNNVEIVCMIRDDFERNFGSDEEE